MTLLVDGQVVAIEAGDAPRLVTGTAPDVLTLEVDEGVAARLLEEATLYGTEITCAADGASQAFAGWTILGTSPSSTRGTAVLSLADPRWTWPRYVRARAYNVRLRTGTRRRERSDGPLAVRQVADDEAFARWSLKGSREGLVAWTGADAVRDVLDMVTDATGRRWRDPDGVLGKVDLPPPENLEVRGDLGAVVGSVLVAVGGRLNVYVDVDGSLVLIDMHDLSERDLLTGGGGGRTAERGAAPSLRELVGEPLWGVQDRRMERPSKVVVLFDMGIELRLDSREFVASAPIVSTTDRLVFADQVLQLPEDAKIGDRDLVVGTWVPQLDYHTWLQGKSPADLPNLSRAILRKHWLSGALEYYGRLDPTGLWSRRVAALRQHARQTLQIRRPWRDRIRQVEPLRIGVWDFETGSRGASPVFLDYAEWLSWRSPESRTVNDGPEAHERVRNRYAANAAGGGIVDARVDVMLAGGGAAPALLSVVDQDQKILRVDFAFDFQGEAVDYLPSALTKASVPSASPGQAIPWLAEGELTESHEISTVVSCTLGAPNDNRRFWRVEVDALDLALGEGLPFGDQLNAEGPEVQVLIDPQRELARIAWDDDRADDIRRVFSEDLNAERDLDPQSFLPGPINLETLESIAQAQALQVYLQYVDHVEGELNVGFNPALRPRGSVEAVEHRFGPDGATTSVKFRSDVPQVDLRSLLPAGVRRMVYREVDL